MPLPPHGLFYPIVVPNFCSVTVLIFYFFKFFQVHWAGKRETQTD